MENIKYFLAANSTLGFVSRFDQLYDPYGNWFLYIIKGGPGTGKSTLMKSIAKAASERGITSELIYCSSDPDSLDGVIFPSLKVAIADGTAPHTLDPIFPGVADTIINLSDCWDRKKLYTFKNKIKEKTTQNSVYHKKSKNYLSACKNIDYSTECILKQVIIEDKINLYCKNTSKKLFKSNLNSIGSEKIRFLSGITPKGIFVFEDTINSICDKIYVLEDDYGVASSIILKNLKQSALEAGFDITVCYCPTDPYNKLEYLIIPQIKTSFAVANNYHPLNQIVPYKTIHCKRFIDLEKLNDEKERLKFNKKIKLELIKKAVENLQLAKSTHDELEEMYIQSMNFSKVNKLSDSLIAEILKDA